MRPLIPCVAPGDILRGTKHLRHYLQTASMLNYVQHLGMGGSPAKSKELLYKPFKNERFMVTVNAWGMLGVCSLDSKVVLLFGNPSKPQRRPGSRPKPMSLTMPSLDGHAAHQLRMNSTIFSKWFIRTNYKQTDTNHWEDHAHFMWVSLHLNMSSIQADSPVNFSFKEGSSAPFTIIDHLKSRTRRICRDDLHAIVKKWVGRGVTRDTAYVSIHDRYTRHGYGPRLEDITRWRAEIREICSNTRVSHQIKDIEMPIFAAEIIENS